jgi:hypothetical protein
MVGVVDVLFRSIAYFKVIFKLLSTNRAISAVWLSYQQQIRTHATGSGLVPG